MAKQKILVVDDEIYILHILDFSLTMEGYEVISADNGAEAFDLALKDKPDIIVTDFQMPIMTGMELIGKLRQHDATKDIPVIMLTARSFAVPQEQQEALRISGCLSKPFSPKELLGHIEDILYQKELVTDD